MQWLLWSVALLLVSGMAALLSGRSARVATRLGCGGAVAACLVGLVPAVRVLAGGPIESLRWNWSVPYGSLYLEVDALSAFFLLLIFVVVGLSAVYGSEYLRPYRERKSLGATWFFFNVLAAGMVLVVTARNGVLFLVAWEIMSLASFFLVTFEDEHREVRQAGWTYLVATHLGTTFLFALFLLFGGTGGSLDFDRFAAASGIDGGRANLLFLLALVGFGTKAGFMPLHVWLPEAHPAAPSHVSAVMSGVMIKTGIYGLLRTLSILGAPPAWWGWLLIGIGLVSGVLGVLFALAQHDLKRLLAYSSVENMGIIAGGLGVGVLGRALGSPMLTVLGFGGAMLHVLNHALFKSLLFMGAGAVLHATGTRRLDELGGLLRRMPWTGAAFLVGSVAIVGLPPLNGFAGEFMIYMGALHGARTLDSGGAVPLVVLIAGLAMIGGLAVACFTKAFGIAFLGEPRRPELPPAHDPPRAMRWPMLILAAACVLVGILAPWIAMALMPVVAVVSGGPAASQALMDSLGPWRGITAVASVFVLLIAALAVSRRRLLAGRSKGSTVTWDCGYAQTSPRLQYTGSSFVQPLTDLFSMFLRTRKTIVAPDGCFPRDASLATDTPDVCRETLYRPMFAGIGRMLAALRWLQHGHIHLYVLYIALTLLVLLIWKLD